MAKTAPKTTTYIIVDTPEDETVVASKGTAAHTVLLTRKLGFMCSVYSLRVVRKVRFLPLWRSEVVASWEDSKDEAVAKFQETFAPE